MLNANFWYFCFKFYYLVLTLSFLKQLILDIWKWSLGVYTSMFTIFPLSAVLYTMPTFSPSTTYNGFENFREKFKISKVLIHRLFFVHNLKWGYFPCQLIMSVSNNAVNINLYFSHDLVYTKETSESVRLFLLSSCIVILLRPVFPWKWKKNKIKPPEKTFLLFCQNLVWGETEEKK